MNRCRRLEDTFLRCCLLDLQAPKPGNVGLHGPGHGMTVRDLQYSAELSAPVLAEPGRTVGERILGAAELVMQRVGCNTNLGILLLCAPLCQAYLTQPCPLPDGLQNVLDALTLEDARLAFKAIALMRPAGLGRSRRHDVSGPARVTLLEAMRYAAERDRIAYQYASGYADVFAQGVPLIRAFRPRWHEDDPDIWATVDCYLGFLSAFPDSHVQRKHGAETARWLLDRAVSLETDLKACDNRADAVSLLLESDNELKRRAINPGTTADLTVASQLAAKLEAPA